MQPLWLRSLSDAELLAVILRSGTGGSTSVDLACEILQKSGGEEFVRTGTKSVFLNFVSKGNRKSKGTADQVHRRTLQENG